MNNKPRALKKAIVTGAGGFLGQHLVQLLRTSGYSVTGIGLSRGILYPDTVDVLLDLSEPEILDPYLDEQTVIFHMAGSADVRGSVENPVTDFNNNVLVAINVIESVRKTNSTMIFPSTGSVYDPNSPLPYSESTAVRPSSPYAAAKVAIEAYCMAYFQSFGVDTRVVRLFSVFGPGMQRFAIYDFFQRLRRNPHQLVIRGDGGQTRDYLYVEDAVRGLMLVSKDGVPGGVYNIASALPRTMLEVAKAVAHAMRLENCSIITDNISYLAEVYRMEANVSAALHLGFSPLTNFELGLAQTIKWLGEESKHD